MIANFDIWLPTKKAKKLSNFSSEDARQVPRLRRRLRTAPRWNHRGWHTISTLSFRDSPIPPKVRQNSALFRRVSLIEQISNVSASSRIFPGHNEAAHRSDLVPGTRLSLEVNLS
jgi:hypothetical protein